MNRNVSTSLVSAPLCWVCWVLRVIRVSFQHCIGVRGSDRDTRIEFSFTGHDRRVRRLSDPKSHPDPAWNVVCPGLTLHHMH